MIFIVWVPKLAWIPCGMLSSMAICDWGRSSKCHRNMSHQLTDMIRFASKFVFFLSYRIQFSIWMIVDRNCCSLDDAVGLHMLETFSMDLGAVIIPTITSISTAKGKQSILLSLGNAPLRYGCRWEDVLLA